MNRSNLCRKNSTRRKNTTVGSGSRPSVEFIIKSAQATLKEIEQYKRIQKPKFSPKRDAQASLLRTSNPNTNGQATDSALAFRVKSAFESDTNLLENYLFSPSNGSDQNSKKRPTYGSTKSKGSQNELQNYYSPFENDSASKQKKDFIIRRKKTGSNELRKISFHSTSSRATTRESDGGLSLTTEKKEEDCSDKYLNEPIMPIHEEEKTEISLRTSILNSLQFDHRDLALLQLEAKDLDDKLKLTDFYDDNLHQSQSKGVQDDLILKKDKQVDFDVKIGDIIGEGAYGQVYIALNMETGQFLAVKHIFMAELPNRSVCDLENLCQEIVVYQKLEHPNIVRYLGAKQEEEDVYIYMEYMPGGSISSMLKQYGSFEEKVIKKFTKQVVLGLDYLHSKGVIHQDIKGANIMSDGCGNVKLADFGAAKSVEDYSLLASVSNSEVCTSIKGSLFWMAPELLNQEKHGRKIDIWSLGCTIIEMATANNPWPKVKSYTELIYTVMTQKCPPIPSHLSECAKDFVRQCCQFDKKLRPSTRELLKHPFLN